LDALLPYLDGTTKEPSVTEEHKRTVALCSKGRESDLPPYFEGGMERSMTRRHNERCGKCKEAIKEILASAFGEVRREYSIHLSTRLEDY